MSNTYEIHRRVILDQVVLIKAESSEEALMKAEEDIEDKDILDTIEEVIVFDKSLIILK